MPIVNPFKRNESKFVERGSINHKTLPPRIIN